MTPLTQTTFEVRKDDWSKTRFLQETLSTELSQDEVLLKIDRFALTANNISYAGAGDLLGYWGFFPTEAGWGRIPAMAYADVIASNHESVAVGERVWGFFPMSTHLKITAGKVRADQFVDISEHRAEYAPAYSQFQRAAANPIYSPQREDQDSLLRGLFMTSWLAEDFMQDNDCFGANHYLITSASSKTSIALAFAVRERGQQHSVGLTSPGNRAFCEQLGCYDRVICYDEIATLDGSQPAVVVDMAGSAQVISELHHHYAEAMKYSCQVGATHYEEMGAVEGLPGAKPEFFFAPSQIQKRSEEWGPQELQQRLGKGFTGFREFCDSWLQIKRGAGESAVAETYQTVLSGSASPNTGLILSLRD